MYHLLNFLFLGIPLIYYYTNLNSSIICCLSCGDKYLSFGISLLASFWNDSLEFNSLDFFDTLVILSAILLPVASAVFRIGLFEAVFIAFVSTLVTPDFLALSTSF